ncbi:hypothetical protein F2Q69_00050448 [Brassica cretica]|uniref:Uncharacterized protein n=1 Tax=Brassica cretica TaxID=69181 RepID=A0A8S9PIC9_BRACR|nr:hypothetical protein F2Q69_00050448 [Brassica cretica]
MTPNLRWCSSALSLGRGGFQLLLRRLTFPGSGGFFSPAIVVFVLGCVGSGERLAGSGGLSQAVKAMGGSDTCPRCHSGFDT